MVECDECGRGVSLADRLRRLRNRALRAIGLQVIPKPPPPTDPYQNHFAAASWMLDNWDYCMGQGRNPNPEDAWAYQAMNAVRDLLDDCVTIYWHKKFPEYKRYHSEDEARARKLLDSWFPAKEKKEVSV